ncbi:hypothetical protein AUEXF2481DRAFT_4619 [Aureobasidium subglaciale EXF-2481]|uniref:N-acetyltransferase domain-containing protein n=1 Tax=Aureobasidium subglaciale (strain EXF-2481) TaxID=1043005 RepID=A0A074YHX6_AURSE|nr:uncharacterized protein AUEXF2481DRAFT_4619 [Aureobasidium subglaciale EXF-2481]KAI5199316.1 hypothetical protein E4T38_07096 [Aureobasidium subglaciale]KAI5218252.1 hypothetical protein E4T40_07027 [Aureobasidium subglaciale]KAI5221681.1 hypothetical protein E4T41_06947 [Aureobasidium subglaciale]KAI5259128.1 hypothetical protein E4T46_06925 [Aureobasidium subglaciale]KEQ95649.1 hypothetical protein AUEXF2481DRAFT_4619 [Aureobasidium subglaciale EXF-2481]
MPGGKRQQKKASPWISDRELKKMTAGAAPPPVEGPAIDYGDEVDPQLFCQWGEHATPPIWDDRPVYQDRDLSKTIKEWQSKVPVESKPFGITSNVKGSTNFSFKVGQTNAPGGLLYFLPPKHDESLMCELVPRAWIPHNFESGQSLQSFWQQQISGAPQPQEESDFGDRKPFWDRYLTVNSAVQCFPAQPDYEECDTRRDRQIDKKGREMDRGSQGWTNRYLQDPDQFMKTRFDRKAGSAEGKQRDDEPPKASLFEETPMIENSLKPALHLSIRMAQVGDLPQITDIYNHYVKNSVCTMEMEQDLISITDMRNRLESARSGHLPFLVACSPVGYGGKKRHPDRFPCETVLGFAYADEYAGPRTAFRFSVEVALFALPGRKWARKGTSKCLMDKLLGLLDQFYIQRGGYQLDEDLGLGTQRLVSRIFLNYLNSEEDNTKEWMKPYLESWGFEEQTTIKKVGYKLGQVVDVTLFHRETGLVIVPSNPPIPPPKT